MEWDIRGLEDLHKLKVLEDQGIKINRSAIAKKLQVDRRTVVKYINGYKKKKSRDKPSKFDQYYPKIKEVLERKEFMYKSELYKYLVETIGMEGAQSSFRRYIRKTETLNIYFEVKGGKDKK